MRDWGFLGEVLHRSPDNAANVVRATATAASLLKTVRDTFPAYTLHDEQHAVNVVRLMDRLAAPRIEQLDPLEAGLLILSAYLHDIGMSYSPEERAAIPEEEEFQAFLRRDSDAFLAVHHNGGEPTRAVVEQYGRLRHADRVRLHLDRMERAEPGLLRWDGTSLIPALHRLCRSHNEPASSLLDQEFGLMRGRADVRFCAMLLRLADIMDFGRSRAPQILYDYLGLAEPGSPVTAESARHWDQQMAGAGFDFPPGPAGEWPAIYPVTYAANPENPDVEHAIRRSLDAVRTELQLCRPVRDQCPRWRDLPMPGDIDTNQIEGLGYTYGEFRFELDRSAVLELFTGEQLYEDRFAFVRELLQNAIDTVLARRAIHGAVEGVADDVAVTCWQDGEGFVWLRVDDSGMGMDERLLKEYFLRVGRSYFASSEFEAQMIRRPASARFTPISRFGIGVLSCFMAGDRVEVSTRRLVRGGAEPETGVALRLSLQRDRDFFILRRPGQGGDDMPAQVRGDQGFRRQTGTSIAVRIDPDRTGIEVEQLVRKTHQFLGAPPVGVTVNGRSAGHHASWAARVPLTAPVVTHIGTGHQPMTGRLPCLQGFRLVAVPLNLDATAGTTSVGGRLLAFAAIGAEDTHQPDLLAGWPDGDGEHRVALSRAVLRTTWDVQIGRRFSRGRDEELSFAVTMAQHVDRETIGRAVETLPSSPMRPPSMFPDETQLERARMLTEYPGALRKLLAEVHEFGPVPYRLASSFRIPFEDAGMADVGKSLLPRAAIHWSHNGIVLPTKPTGSQMRPTGLGSRTVAFVGSLTLSGPLRPDLTISRTALQAIPFAVHSAVQMAVRLALERLEVPEAARTTIGSATLFNVPPAEHCSMTAIKADPLLISGAWNDQAVIPLRDGMASVEELRARISRGERVELAVASGRPWARGSVGFAFCRELVPALLRLFVPVSLDPGGAMHAHRDVAPAESMSDLLPPLFAVPFSSGSDLARVGTHLNAAHPLAQWISANATVLSRDFAAPFNRVFRLAPYISEVDDVNEALDRVARARTSIPAPPAEAYVRADENGWWVSR